MGEDHRGISSGESSGTDRPTDREEFYTSSEAARVLGITNRRVRALAQEGRLEGERTEGGWKLYRYSVHNFRDRRRESSVPSEASQRLTDAREWVERVTDLERELGRLEGRLEIEAVARSTLEETLQRERERADRLEEELREERSEARRGFWRRLFGS